MVQLNSGKEKVWNKQQEIYFCTVADARFVLETTALYNSLAREALRFNRHLIFWVLCIDDTSMSIFKKINSNIQTISLSSLNDQELLSVKNSRKVGEFAQTSKASLVNYLLKKMAPSRILTFVDSDIYFFTDPVLTYENNTRWSVLITPHWFTGKKKGFAKKVGIYNSGLVCFRNDNDGRDCAKLWRRQCIDWCFNRTEDGKFTDQFYLEEWVKKYDSVRVTQRKNVNVGNWSIDGLSIKLKNKKIFVNNEPLVCYHFHGLMLYLNKKGRIKSYPVTVHHKGIYGIYIDELQKIYEKIHGIDASLEFRFAPNPGMLRIVKQIIFRCLKEWLFLILFKFKNKR